jgi:integrase
MKRRENLLTAREVETVGDGWHADGGNLYLRVDGDRRRWIVRVTREGRKRDFGCGSAQRVSLRFAREKRDGILAQLKDGLDPVAAKREAREKAKTEALSGHSFKEAAEAVMQNRESGWKKGSTSFASWLKSVNVDCRPLLKMPVSDITRNDVKAVVAPFWQRGHHAAARALLSRIELVLAYAIANEWRTAANVAAWSVFEHIAPVRPNGGQKPHPALKWREMPAIYAKLGESVSLSTLALQLIILTGCRSNEIRSLRWDEIDLEAKVITIPASRMKRGKDFPVPITDQMLAILKPLHDTKGRDQLVFPGPRPGRPISNQTAWVAFRRVAGEATTHGCRSSLRSWMADHRVEFEVAEAMLSHEPGSAVVNAYQRSPLLERRRPVLEAWSRFVSGEDVAGNVVPMTSGKRQ